jgi:SAM-dependent methyltransferase
MRDLTACPVCGGTEREIVLEFNGLVLLQYMRTSPLSRYNYALCRTCGLVYATRRPEGEEVAWLYSRFDEFLGRTEEEETAGRVTDITPEEREQLNRRLARGWLVSEEDRSASDEWMADVFDERVTNSFHANLLASLIPIAGTRILELRTTTGFILDVLKRAYRAAEVVAMPMSERHAAIIDALNPMPATPLDFESLDVPVEGQFDVILARHLATHAIDPPRLWRVLREKLKPGGYAYLYMENDDHVMRGRKNLLGEMKCFHFQNFDLPTLARVLRYQGLDPVFIRHPRARRSEMLCLARRSDAVQVQPMAASELRDRQTLYRRWRDHSILSLDPELQSLFAGELDDITRRAVEAGDAIRKKGGELIVKKPLRLMHAAGYAQLNASSSH